MEITSLHNDISPCGCYYSMTDLIRVCVVKCRTQGVLGYKRDGGGGGGGVRRSLVFCTQKNTWTLYCAPKKIQDWKQYSNHAFRSCRNFGLNCIRTISLVEIRTQKNTGVENFRPKKIHHPLPPPVTFIPRVPHLGCRTASMGCNSKFVL